MTFDQVVGERFMFLVGDDVTEVDLPFLIAIRLLCNFGVQDEDCLVTPLLQVIPHGFSVGWRRGRQRSSAHQCAAVVK